METIKEAAHDLTMLFLSKSAVDCDANKLADMYKSIYIIIKHQLEK